MAEFRLHLELERASGVLASIVARLAQQGLELKSQKLERAPEGRGGTLRIVAEGEHGDIATLAENMGSARGVGQVAWIEQDGERVFADGEVIEPVPEATAEAEAPDAENGTEIDSGAASFADEDAIDDELDAFLDPEAAVEADAEENAGPKGRAKETSHPDWLESDPDADKPSALHPRPADDDELPMLGRSDDPEPEAEEIEEDDPTSSGSAWGEEGEDDWDDELVDALEESAESESEFESESAPEAGREPEDAFEDEPEDASEPTAGSTESDDDEPSSTGTSKKSPVEATLRRRRRRRR